MRVSKTKLLENREALITTASRLIRERGFEGAGVAEISRQAGLTEGAFYSQFENKNALAAEACRYGFDQSTRLWSEARGKLARYIEAYLSETHLADTGHGCPLAANAGEVSRQAAPVGEAFADGLAGMVERIQLALETELPPKQARRRALALMVAMAGALAAARAAAPADPAMAREILSAARQELKLLATSAG